MSHLSDHLDHSCPLSRFHQLPPGAVGGPVEARLPDLAFNGIAIIGEAPGRDEVEQGRPFVGAAGRRLDEGLAAAGIDRTACLVANSFRFRPEGNRIALFFASARRAQRDDLSVDGDMPSCHGGRCLLQHSHDVKALRASLSAIGARVAIALGNTALWALAGRSGGVTRLAGSDIEGHGGLVVMPTYHPAYLARRRDPALDRAFIEHLCAAGTIAAV